MPNNLREATHEEKLMWLSNVSRGYTRGLFHDMPIDKLPLYHNGTDFYIVMEERRETSKTT